MPDCEIISAFREAECLSSKIIQQFYNKRECVLYSNTFISMSVIYIMKSEIHIYGQTWFKSRPRLKCLFFIKNSLRLNILTYISAVV